MMNYHIIAKGSDTADVDEQINFYSYDYCMYKITPFIPDGCLKKKVTIGHLKRKKIKKNI